MLLIGCTGGIGSGKSTLAAILRRRGAIVADAEHFARQALEPGREAVEEVVAHFGAGIVTEGGAIDRQALAAVVFADASARRALEAIVHPFVRNAIFAIFDANRETDHVVVLDAPLLVESGRRDRYGLDGVIVVDAPEDVALERLVALRQMDEADARARMRAQASRADRLARADFVVLNVGTLAELEEMADRAWAWISGLRAERDGR